MSLFQQRSYKKELLDRADIPFADIRRNMKELDVINRRLGGHDATLDGIVKLTQTSNHFNQQFSIVEIGCGGGDNLRAIKRWAKEINMPVQLTGIDINADCIAYAREQKGNAGIDFIHSDYRKIVFEKKPDIIFSSLFCHHFTDQELVHMLQWKRKNCKIGFFINDLHRHPFAYYSIRLLSQIFSRSYLVKNDAPLSVLRGFKKKEWINLLDAAGCISFTIEKKWAFRWLITCPSYA